MPIIISLLIVLFGSSTFLLIFRLHVLSITKRGMLKSPTWICMFPSLFLLGFAYGF